LVEAGDSLVQERRFVKGSAIPAFFLADFSWTSEAISKAPATELHRFSL
jgi:hypothetical protein